MVAFTKLCEILEKSFRANTKHFNNIPKAPNSLANSFIEFGNALLGDSEKLGKITDSVLNWKNNKPKIIKQH